MEAVQDFPHNFLFICLSSIFYLVNEMFPFHLSTMNLHYHIISCQTFLSIPISLFISRLALGKRKLAAPQECVRLLKQVCFYSIEQR